MIEKLKMEQSPLSEVVEKIREICPSAVTRDGKIDFEVLKTSLATDVADEQFEKYEFTWVGKNAAKIEANRPIRKTLRPVLADSRNWDTTQNLYIEGDNLDALKLLQESYLGRVKMIYIDPPYNTGNDFVYCDNFTMGCAEYLDKKGQCDADGNRLFRNNETNGRFHSDWCSMMYPRLKIARDLLSDDGVIFISIDDHEQANLKKICDEVFGEKNCVGLFKWNKTSKAPSLSKKIRNKYEYVLCYEKKDVQILRGPDSYNTMGPLLNGSNGMSRITFEPGEIDLLFTDGVYPAGNYSTNNGSVILHNDVIVKNNVNVNQFDITAKFKWTQQTLKERMSKGQRIVIKTPKFSTIYYTLLETADKFIAPSDILNKEECGVLRNDEGYGEVRELFSGVAVFEYVKPVSLLKYLIRMHSDDDFTVLDFFSGSATTAHAVMQLNAEDGGNRRFIMVQYPEPTDEKSEAYKAGYKNICEIGRERIRRAGDKIKAENPDKEIDIGFRVLRVDSTNMADIERKPGDTIQTGLLDAVDNIKPDRGDLDLLFGVMVDCGLMLDYTIKTHEIDGKRYYVVNNGDLVACFENNIPEKLIYEIAKMNPTCAVFRDSSFAEPADKINLAEIFKNITGDDNRVKVL